MFHFKLWFEFKLLPFLERNYVKAKWWLIHRYHPAHKYNVVHTKLPDGYHDKDDVMLYACFALLIDFIEKEKPHKHFDIRGSSFSNEDYGWEASGRQEHRAKWRKVFKLYRWWTRTRPKLVAELDAMYEAQGHNLHRSWQEINTFEDNLEQLTQNKLIELIGIRGFLWT